MWLVSKRFRVIVILSPAKAGRGILRPRESADAVDKDARAASSQTFLTSAQLARDFRKVPAESLRVPPG